MEQWKKNLVTCQFCENKENPCTEVKVEFVENEKWKLKSWKCDNYCQADEPMKEIN